MSKQLFLKEKGMCVTCDMCGNYEVDHYGNRKMCESCLDQEAKKDFLDFISCMSLPLSFGLTFIAVHVVLKWLGYT